VRITRKAEYAVRALLDLALHAPAGGSVRSAQIARRTAVPDNFLDAILLDLRKAGLVSSKRGPDGGHWLARDPSRVTVRAIVEAIDGPMSGGGQAARKTETPADACVRSLFAQVHQAAGTVLQDVTLDDLRRQADTCGALDFAI
jgi:Rrf2 family iron-sulfur cluster assembly transcriptional regulator